MHDMMRRRLAVSALVAVCLALTAPTARSELASALNSDPDAEIIGANVPAPPPPPQPELPQGLQPDTLTPQAAARIPSTDAILQRQIKFWHNEAIRVHVDDYNQTDEDGFVIDPKVPGPCYTSRAFAMVHIAIYDAYAGISGAPTYLKYDKTPVVKKNLQWVAQWFAIRQAARTVINRELRTNQQPEAKSSFFSVLGTILTGINWGDTVANAIDKARRGDGAFSEPVFTEVPESDKPRAHQPDPTIPDEPGSPGEQENYAAHWEEVPGFGYTNLLDSVTRIPDPGPAIGYGPGPDEDFEEVKRVGAFDASQPPDPPRSEEQENIGIFWAYDGTFAIGTPPRLYNDALDGIIRAANIPDALALARLYAVANIAMADGAIAAWREKYYHNFWRPTVGIRNETEPGFMTDPNWRPLGVPKTNSNLAAATRNPSFPAYPSGHATIGTAAFTAIKAELGVDDSFSFSFTSAEFDGIAQIACEDPMGDCPTRPEMKNKPFTIGQAITENQESRLYLGVHWRMDSTQGGVLGEEIGAAVSAAFPGRA